MRIETPTEHGESTRDNREENKQAGFVSRRRFMGCAAVAGTAAIGSAALGTVRANLLFRSGEHEGYPNGEALQQLLLRSQAGPSGKPFPVMDLHTHPAMKAYMFKQRFWKRHVAPPDSFITNLNVDMDSLVNGGVVGVMMVHHPVSYTQDPEETMFGAVAYLVKHGGEEVVAIGSDFDGTLNPKGLSSPRDFSVIRKALLSKYSEEQVSKFLFGNGERLLKLGWGKA